MTKAKTGRTGVVTRKKFRYAETADSVVGRIQGIVRKVFGDKVENKSQIYGSQGYFYLNLRGLERSNKAYGTKLVLRRHHVGGLAPRLRKLERLGR